MVKESKHATNHTTESLVRVRVRVRLGFSPTVGVEVRFTDSGKLVKAAMKARVLEEKQVRWTSIPAFSPRRHAFSRTVF